MAKADTFEKLERIDGVVAHPPGSLGTSIQGELDRDTAALLARADVLDKAHGFRKAGWSFASDSGHDAGLGVYKSADGGLCVLTEALNVKFAPSTSAVEIEALLKQHKLRKRRKLGFGDNLMMVGPSGAGSDPLRLTRALASHPSVEFAEPVIVEMIGPRVDRGDLPPENR
jgi:hypothetical protein